jgi:hypothetical protein
MGLGLGGIPSFESMEHESKVTTWRKMKESHVQRYLTRERLFVGWNVEVTNGGNHVFRDGVSNRIMHKACYDKDVHPFIIVREDG